MRSVFGLWVVEVNLGYGNVRIKCWIGGGQVGERIEIGIAIGRV